MRQEVCIQKKVREKKVEQEKSCLTVQVDKVRFYSNPATAKKMAKVFPQHSPLVGNEFFNIKSAICRREREGMKRKEKKILLRKKSTFCVWEQRKPFTSW
jgi:hypothetical protein